MMQYKIAVDLNDGKRNAPPFTVDVAHPSELANHETVMGELCNDYDEPFGVGTTLTITRVA